MSTQKTGILFVTLGSFTKLRGGEPGYNREASLAAQLSPDKADLLLTKRAEALAWLKQESLEHWHGVPVANLEWNHDLVAGPDFHGQDGGGAYYPALRRFDGRFFQTLGQPGRLSLFQSAHHFLFICGLYGLLRPMESVQLYSCPVSDGSPALEIWDGPLTDVLLDYIRIHNIQRVFDLTMMNARRKLIRWSDIRGELSGNVLHAAGSMSAGDYTLVALGQLMRERLLTANEDDLMGIRLGTKLSTSSQDIWFHERPTAHGPRELLPDGADELDRTRRGIVAFLNLLEGYAGTSQEKVGERIRRLADAGRLGDDLAKAMYRVMKFRNDFHHGHRTGDLSPDERHQLTADIKKLNESAQNRGWSIPEFLKR